MLARQARRAAPPTVIHVSGGQAAGSESPPGKLKQLYRRYQQWGQQPVLKFGRQSKNRS